MFSSPSSHPVSLPFEVIIFRHWKEIDRLSNTAKLIEQELKPVRMINYGIDDVNSLCFDPHTSLLLYPPEQARESAIELPQVKTLILVDGTWKQVRKMMGRIPHLRELQRLSVSAQTPPYPRLRTPSVQGGLSTVEAMGSALRQFGLIEAENRLREANWQCLDRLRLLSGIRHPLEPGLSFTDLRKLDPF